MINKYSPNKYTPYTRGFGKRFPGLLKNLQFQHVGVVDQFPVAIGLPGKSALHAKISGLDFDALNDNAGTQHFPCALVIVRTVQHIEAMHPPLGGFPVHGLARCRRRVLLHRCNALQRPGDVRHLEQAVFVKFMVKVHKRRVWLFG